MSSLIFKFLRRKQCKSTVTVHERFLIVDEERCDLDVGHAGLHTAKMGKYVWNDNERMKTWFESNYKDLPK